MVYLCMKRTEEKLVLSLLTIKRRIYTIPYVYAVSTGLLLPPKYLPKLHLSGYLDD